MRLQHRSLTTINLAFVAALAGLASSACANGGSDTTPSAAEPEASEATPAEAATLEEGSACPMLTEGVVVDTIDTPDGIALRFTTASGDVEDLRARVEHMANMYEMHAGRGSMMWRHMGHMRVEGEQPGPAAGGEIPRAVSLGLFAQGGVAETCSGPATAAFRLLALDENSGAGRHEGFHHRLLGAPMPAATARSEVIDDGAQLVLTPRDPAELDALREQVRDHHKHMNAGECWLPQA